MRKRPIAISMIAPFICFALAGPAGAIESGSLVQPGTEFPAAPVSHGGLSLSAPTNVVAPAPGPEAAPPPPEPAPKRRKRRR